MRILRFNKPKSKEQDWFVWRRVSLKRQQTKAADCGQQ
jgi:hypothetical protein